MLTGFFLGRLAGFGVDSRPDGPYGFERAFLKEVNDEVVPAAACPERPAQDWQQIISLGIRG